MFKNRKGFIKFAIRIESDKLVFCVKETFTGEEQTTCKNVKEVSLSSLAGYYNNKIVVRALEAYVHLLSDDKLWDTNCPDGDVKI